MASKNAALDPQYDKVAANDAALNTLYQAWRQSRPGSKDRLAYKAQIRTRLGELGIDPEQWDLDGIKDGKLGVDHLNTFERNPKKWLAVAMGSYLGGATLLGGGGAAGAAGAGGGGGAAAGAGLSLGSKLLLGASLAGTVIGAVGQIKAGNAAKEMAEYNAGVSEGLAQDALDRGQIDEMRFRQRIRGTIGTIRAGLASQNIDVGVGSAVDVQADAAFLGEQDAYQIRANAMQEALGYKTEAENFRRGGANAQREARFGAAQTVLGGATAVGSALANKYRG